MREPVRWSVRVGGDDAASATAYVRRHRIEIGAPLSFDEEHPRATALEHLVAAVAADAVVGFGSRAHRRRLEVDAVEAVAHVELQNPLTHLGVVGEKGHPGIVRLDVKVYVDTPEDEARVREAWGEALARSPMRHTLSSAVDLTYELKLA